MNLPLVQSGLYKVVIADGASGAVLYGYLVDTPQARWAWEQTGAVRPDDIKVGMKFLAHVKVERGTHDEDRNRIGRLETDPDVGSMFEPTPVEAERAHFIADALAQRVLGDFEPAPGESPDAYHERLRAAERTFRERYPEWQPERFNRLGRVG
jgi:hypothetical protein